MGLLSGDNAEQVPVNAASSLPFISTGGGGVTG